MGEGDTAGPPKGRPVYFPGDLASERRHRVRLLGDTAGDRKHRGHAASCQGRPQRRLHHGPDRVL